MKFDFALNIKSITYVSFDMMTIKFKRKSIYFIDDWSRTWFFQSSFIDCFNNIRKINLQYISFYFIYLV